MQRSYTNNLYALYVIKISKWFNLVMPIIVLFFQDNDLSMKDIFVLKAVYSFGIVAFEIPSGYFADYLGRRKTLIIGSLMGCMGFIGYNIAGTFAGFIVAEIILGIGQSFISGADSALLFDSLKAAKREKEYTKLEGRIASIGNYSEAIAGVLAGFLATISLNTPVVCQVVVAASAIPAAIFLVEPPMKKVVGNGVSHILAAVKQSMISPQLRTAILFSAIIGTSTLTFAWLVQPYFKQIGLPVALFGTMWTMLNLTVGTSSIFAHRIEEKLGQRKLYLTILCSIPILYLLTGASISYLGFAFIFLFYLCRGVATPILKNYINLHTDSDIRATVLSVRNFVIRIIFIAVGPLAGWLIDNYSLSLAYYIIGGFFLVLGVIILLPQIVKPKTGAKKQEQC